MQHKARERKIIEGHRPSIMLAFWFYLVVIVLPLLAGKVMVDIYGEHHFSTVFSAAEQNLKEDLADFAHYSHVEPFVTKSILDLETELGLPALIQNEFGRPALNNQTFDVLSAEGLLQKVKQKFRQKTGADPVFVFSVPSENKKILHWVAPAYKEQVGYIGNAALKILMNTLRQRSQNKAGFSKPRLFDRVANSVFGAKFEPELANRQLRHAFTTKFSGKRLFVYYNFFPEQYLIGNSAAGFLIAFCEDDISNRKRLAWARSFNRPKNFRRYFGIFPAGFDMRLKHTGDDILRAYYPMPISVARVGSHGGKSIMNQNIRNGLLTKKPAMSLFLISQTDLQTERKNLEKYTSASSLLLLILNFVGLYFLKQLCFEGRTVLKIRSKLFLAIFAAAILPLAGFFVLANRYFDFYQNLLISNKQQAIEQEVQLLELSITNNETARQFELEKFKELVRKSVSRTPEEISALLDQASEKLHDGYMFFRNDGLVLENFSSLAGLTSYDSDRLDFLSQVFKSQTARIFQEMGILQGQYFQKMKRTPIGKKILAMGKLFTGIDLDSFCIQDGEFFQTEKSDEGHYRLITYNLFPDNSNESDKRAFIAFILNARRVTSEFLQKQVTNPGFFVSRENEVLRRSAVFQVQKVLSDKFSLLEAWPENLLTDKDFVQAAGRLGPDKTSAGWIEFSQEGIPTIFAARKVHKLPFVVVSKAIVDSFAGKKSLLGIIMLLLLLYSMMLISLIASSLTEVFLKPIRSLFQATSLINVGEFPLIEYKSELELADMVKNFNSMTIGLQHRERLERFISEDATRSVVNESLHLEEHRSEKINAAVLFTHIRDFDQICEKLSAEKTIDCLNLYYAAMEPVIKRHNGVIDKYIGDAIMTVFSRHDGSNSSLCADAGYAALGLIEALHELNQTLAERQIEPIVIGVGISYGEMIRGKIGALTGRKDFTIIGDTVNFAARLESISHVRSTASIMVSKDFARLCESEFKFEAFGKIAIKGKQRKQQVFELCGLKNET
ncbi:MAG: adenylate cyclase [Clostridiales bacterium]|nr:adenylate cyclase [Clostridiales bacterium]MDN5281470.1 adenylate cyclase [Candidatus Ozemobacter sp.]